MPDLPVQRFLAAYFLELRLTCWHWSYLVLQAVWGAFVLWGQSFGGDPSAAGILFSMSLGMIPMATLGAMLFSGLSVSRTSRNRFDMLEAAYPIGIEVILARWLAITTATSGFLIVPMGIALARGPFDSFLQALPIFLLENLTLFALISAAVWLIQLTIGVKRWTYPLFAVIWLASAILPASLDIKTFPVALLLGFAAHGWLEVSYSELWGRLTVEPLPFYHDLFYLALVGLLIGLIAAVVHQRRFYRRSLLAFILIGLSSGIVLAAARGYSLFIIETNDQIRRHDQFIADQLQNLTLPVEMPYTIRAYDITLDLSDAAVPQFRTQMELVNRGSTPLTQIDLSLHYQLAITASNVPYERTGDFVTLRPDEALLPGEGLTVDLTYGGALWYYDGSRMMGRPREVISFIRAEGVDLPCAVAWYPIPGRIMIGRTYFFSEESTRATPDCLADEPARFHLRIEHADPLTFASNLPRVSENQFAAEGATWASLLGAPTLVVEESEDVTLVTAKVSRDAVQPIVMSHYTANLVHLRRFFPDLEGVTVFATQSSLSSKWYQIATPVTDGRLIVDVKLLYLSAFATSPYNAYMFGEQAMLYSLFNRGESPFGEEHSYVENIGYFLGAHALVKGDPEALGVMLAEGIPAGEGGQQVFSHQTTAERYPLAQVFYKVYVEQGEEALVALFQTIRAEAKQLNALSVEEAAAWIEEAAHAD